MRFLNVKADQQSIFPRSKPQTQGSSPVVLTCIRGTDSPTYTNSTETKRELPNPFREAIITLTPKPGKGNVNEHRALSFRNRLHIGKQHNLPLTRRKERSGVLSAVEDR